MITELTTYQSMRNGTLDRKTDTQSTIYIEILETPQKMVLSGIGMMESGSRI